MGPNYYAMLNACDARRDAMRKAVRPWVRTAALVAVYVAGAWAARGML